jgi:hypothetical protein
VPSSYRITGVNLNNKYENVIPGVSKKSPRRDLNQLIARAPTTTFCRFSHFNYFYNYKIINIKIDQPSCRF